MSALSQKHTDSQPHQAVFCCCFLVLVGQSSLVFKGLGKGGRRLFVSSGGDRMEWLSYNSALEGDALGYRASGGRRSRVQSLRKELTVLELSLYSQVLPQQVHHHSLHVSSDATAVPRQREEGIDK